MIKKFTILITTAAILPMTAAAGGMTVKLSGGLDNQYGIIKQSKKFRYQGADKLRSNALVNNGKLKIEADGQAECGTKYGGMLEFNANTSQSKTGSSDVLKKSMVYAEAGFGRLEAGTYDGAAGKFRENTFEGMDVGTGGALGGDAVFWINSKTNSGADLDSVFILSPDLVVAHDASGSANKVIYYTPKWNGLQAGLTYVPDAAVKGTINSAMSKPGNTFSTTEIEADGSAKDPNAKPGYKNVLDLSVKYDVKFNDVAVSTFVSGEIGQSKKYVVGGQSNSRKPLRAWDVGSSVTYKDFTIGASYGDWGTSGMYKSISKAFKRRSSFYTVGAGYKYNDLAASVTYFNAKAAGGIAGSVASATYDKASMLSFGVEYKLMPGFKPYAEVTNFKLAEHGQPVNKGNLMLVGTKFSF